MKTDTQVQQDVLAELKWEPSANAAQVGVEVKDGIVTLAGQVSSYAEKWDAERAAQRVSGVKAVVNSMAIALSESNHRSDADLTQSAEHVLQLMTNLPKDRVKVAVESGWITLSGELDWEYQREAAARAVRYLMGVKGVNYRIAIKSVASVGAVKSDIEAALKRRAKSDAQQISVEVSDAEVTLTGTVHSWAERELVRYSAWGTPGVRNVVDNMTMAS